MPLLFLTFLGLDPENRSFRKREVPRAEGPSGNETLNQGDLVQGLVQATFWLDDRGRVPQLGQPHFPHR